MKIKPYYLGWLLILIFLIPTLFFPFSDDISVFARGADTLIGGGRLYTDYVDIKPPLIYYLVAFAKLLFGNQEYSLRIFDFIWQLATIISVCFIIKKLNANKYLGIVFGVVYSISYTILYYSNTLECETLAALPLAWIAYIQVLPGNRKGLLIIQGLMAGFITALKYPLGLVLPAIMIDYLLARQYHLKTVLIRSLFLLLGFVAFLSVSFLPLTESGVWQSFVRIMQYVKFYAGYNAVGSAQMRTLLKGVGYFFGDIYSLSLSVFTAIGMSFLLGKKLDGQMRHLFSFLFVLTAAMFISMIVEMKFLAYHYPRMYLPAILFASTGLLYFIDKLMLKWKQETVYFKFIVSSLVLAGLFFSPLPRWINISKIPYYALTNQQKYNRSFNDGEGDLSVRQESLDAAYAVNRHLLPGDTAIIVANNGNIIAQFLKTRNLSKFAHSCFYFNNMNEKSRLDEFKNELINAKWVIVQKNDAMYFFNHHNRTSYESLMGDSCLAGYIKNSYSKYFENQRFLVLRKSV